jgi:DNA-binding NtrC family response regulator
MPQTGSTILIVADSIDYLLKLSNSLKNKVPGLGVFTAITYVEAAEVIVNEQPKFMIVDINLPEKNGLDLLKFVRVKYPHIICAVVTAKATSYYKSKVKELGVLHFFDHTVKTDTLIKALTIT